MRFDAFTGGIEPGGLRSKDEIRILICYLLSSVDAPLSKEDVISIIVEEGLANYFEVTDAIAEMAGNGLIVFNGAEKQFCIVSDSGHMVAKQLDSSLPLSVRDKAVNAAIRLLEKAKREKENRVEIEKTERGYCVACHISGGETDLMNFSLYVPDLYQAQVVKENFQRSPETLYRMLLALVTGNTDIAADILRKSVPKGADSPRN